VTEDPRHAHIREIAKMVMPPGPPPERMSPTRKAEITDELCTAWINNSSQRLGQLIANIANAPGNDPYYIEDEDFAVKIKEYLK
jgi:hypothetical protein